MRSFILKLAFTVIIFAFIFQHIQWVELKDAFLRQQPLYVFAAACAVLLQMIAGGLRWHEIRSAIDPAADNPTRTVLYYYASLFFNIAMPSTLGSDVARGWLAKRSGSPLTLTIYGVLVDRIMSLAGLCLLVASTLPLLFPLLHIGAEWGFAAATIGWMLAIGGYLALRILLGLLEGLSHLRFVGSIIGALSGVTGRHGHIIRATLWAIIAHINYATATYALAMGLGMQVSWVACLVLVPLVLFISTLPISLGGWGLREFGMATALALVHIANAPAIALALQLGLLTTVMSAGGCAMYLMLKK